MIDIEIICNDYTIIPEYMDSSFYPHLAWFFGHPRNNKCFFNQLVNVNILIFNVCESMNYLHTEEEPL